MFKFDAIWNFGDFHGRSDRTEFWSYFALSLTLLFIASYADSYLDSRQQIQNFVNLAVIIPYIAVAIRRLHDINLSGWWVLIALIPVAGTLILLIAMMFPGSQEKNRFGPAVANPATITVSS